MSNWFIYMVECADGSLYTGVATDVERRVKEHNGKSSKAARYTRSRQPVSLIYQEAAENRSLACQREWQVKQLTRSQKLALIRSGRR